jgi:hypothetical protein
MSSTEMEYNTQRTKMIIPEYGRNVQNMIAHAMTIEDRDERNRIARSIIKVMGQLNPHLRDIDDFTHKLWAHLFIMSNFQLDVDSPFPKPTEESFNEKPELLTYPSNNIKYGHYGKTVEMLIEKAITYEEGDEKDALVLNIANLMKRSYLTWNRDSVNDEAILAHLEKLSDGKLIVKDPSKLISTMEVLKNNKPKNNNNRDNKKRHHSKSNRNKKRY